MQTENHINLTITKQSKQSNQINRYFKAKE